MENKNYWLDNPLEFAQNRIDSRQYILLPAIAEIIEKQGAKQVLDYGCGEGYLSNNFTNKTIGLGLFDISTEMIEMARVNAANNSFTSVSAFKTPEEIPENSFDCVVLSLVLMTIGVEEDYKKVLIKCARSLKKDGTVLIGITHPCFRQALFSTHHTKFTLGSEFPYFENHKPFDVYLRTSKAESFIHFEDFHHNLTYTFSMIREAGMYVEDMIELKDKSIETSSFNKLVSPYLILKCRLK